MFEGINRGVVTLTIVIAMGLLLGGLGLLSLAGQDDERVVIVESPASSPGQPIVVDDEEPLSDHEIERASAAAVKLAGGGEVSEIDRSDDLGEAYEVEVVTDAGELDIALDERFERVPNLRYDD